MNIISNASKNPSDFENEMSNINLCRRITYEELCRLSDQSIATPSFLLSSPLYIQLLSNFVPDIMNKSNPSDVGKLVEPILSCAQSVDIMTELLRKCPHIASYVTQGIIDYVKTHQNEPSIYLRIFRLLLVLARESNSIAKSIRSELSLKKIYPIVCIEISLHYNEDITTYLCKELLEVKNPLQHWLICNLPLNIWKKLIIELCNILLLNCNYHIRQYSLLPSSSSLLPSSEVVVEEEVQLQQIISCIRLLFICFHHYDVFSTFFSSFLSELIKTIQCYLLPSSNSVHSNHNILRYFFILLFSCLSIYHRYQRNLSMNTATSLNKNTSLIVSTPESIIEIIIIEISNILIIFKNSNSNELNSYLFFIQMVINKDMILPLRYSIFVDLDIQHMNENTQILPLEDITGALQLLRKKWKDYSNFPLAFESREEIVAKVRI